MNLTKRDICGRVADKLDFCRRDVHKVVDEFLAHIERAFTEGAEVELRGFGAFRLVSRKQRMGRNPRAPAIVLSIPQHFTVKFKAGKELKAHLKALKTNTPR